HVLSVACKVVKKKHISEQFWELGQDTGVYILLQSLCSRFPLEFSPFIRLCISLSECGAEKIFHYLDGLSSYIELLDNNRADSIDTISDGQWQLQRDKFIYRPDSNTSGLVIPKGTLGTLYDENPGLPYIVWDWEYSAWQLILCKIDDLLRIARHNIELSPLSLVNDVKYAIDLVGHMVQSDFSLATRLQPIITRIYPLVQRFNTGNGVTLDMISSCVKCLVTLAQHEPHKVWKDLQQTGFLPYTGRVYSDVAMAASGAGIFPGNYGNLLGNQERQVGQYPVTKEFLCLLSTLIKGLFSKQSVEISQDVLACVIFVQWEIFASFHKWRYMDITEREEIGKRSLEIFHNVLHVSPVVFGDSEVIGKRSSVAVRDAVVHGLLHTNAGETLLHILATGVDAIELRLIEYGSFLNNPAQDLTQLIKLAFSVVNRLLILKPNQDIMSPLEQELTEQHRTVLQDTPLIATIASYIYHRHDPRLPTLSTLLLKRLAMVAPMSIYGSLGIQVEALKDAYQSRLEALTEDTRLKVVILEFLTVAVETQPGLIELFLDLEVKDLSRLNATEVKSTTEKEINLGKWSILQIVLDMIESNKQGTTHCPPELHAACLSFLYSLWQDRRDTAMSVLRKRPQFWENVTTPLFKDLTLSTDIGTKGISAEVKTVAYAMKIISSESYYIASGSLDKDFKAQLQKLQQDNRYVYWSQ
ncbi:nucleoporin NUP188-like, partial [Saccoglossus kowalevskii]|uniref:Nucleoporin NUP188 homolog n=1 Tax=Saccoglossus kowalevskii TaxID=10224 RepID=A0ABM0GYT6_SACKO